MKPGSDRTRPGFSPWLGLALVTAMSCWVRFRALPGPWGTDSLGYFDVIRSGEMSSIDPRSQRWLVAAIVRGSLQLGGWRPAWASVPGVLLSVAVVPVLWLALRRRVGDTLALLPGLLWTFLGSDLEEVCEISADAMLALPGALAVWGLVVASERDERRVPPLVLAGLALGVGAVLKETMLLALVGFACGALTIGRGPARWKHAAAVALPALLLVAAGLLATPDRLGVASQAVASGSAPVRAESGEFLHRVTVAIPQFLVTATSAYGLLFVAALPLLVRLPFRAGRGDAVAAAALAGLLAFDLVPVSLASWSLLPATHARYFLCLMPALLAAVVGALRDTPTSRAERWTSLAAAAFALVFARSSPWAPIVVPLGAILTAWPCLPETGRTFLPERTRLGLAAGVLVAATVAWSGLTRRPATTDWIAAASTGLLVTTPWLVGRDREGPLPYFAVGAGAVLGMAMTGSRFFADAEWTAWSRLPAAGRVFAERVVGRRLRAASVSVGADPSRVVLLDGWDETLRTLGPDDRVLARDVGRLDQGLRLADACRLPDSGLVEVPAELGEAVLFAPARR